MYASGLEVCVKPGISSGNIVLMWSRRAVYASQHIYWKCGCLVVVVHTVAVICWHESIGLVVGNTVYTICSAAERQAGNHLIDSVAFKNNGHEAHMYS